MGALGGSMESKDAFLVTFDDKQYDIQQFLRNHPGGVNTLENYKDKTVVTAMQKYGHSRSAYHLLRDFKVKSDSLEERQFSCKLSDSGRIIVEGENGRTAEELELLEELESRLDWSKPILSQIDKVAEHYQLWVHSAVYKKCTLFENPLLERITFTPWYVAPLVWIPIIVYMTWLQASKYVFGVCEGSCPRPQIPVYQFIYHMCSGVVVWTIIEYCLHRWVFHFKPGNSLLWVKMHFLLHGVHHKVPFDGYRLVFPPVPAAILASIIYTPLQFLLPYPEILLIGGISGFLIYDMIHYYIHHGSPSEGSYLYAMKRYHSSHHFVNPDIGFGISSKFWDIVFNSCAHVRKLNFSLRWK